MQKQKMKTIGKYKIIKKLGSGGFGTVYLVEEQGARFALKRLEKLTDHDDSRRFILESKRVEEIRKKYNLKYLVQVIDILCEHNAYVMEFLPENSRDYFSCESDEEFIVKLIAGVHQLHSIPVIHRDIKPRNIMVKDSIPVLIDFGAASWWDSTSQLISLGTVKYSPPEIICHFNQFRNLKAAHTASMEIYDMDAENSNERFRKIK
jgi:serine/threonine protein kinase